MRTHLDTNRLVLVLALAGLGMSCGGGDGGPTTPVDTTPPTISAVSPDDAATNVAIDAVVTATFSEAIELASVTGTTFTLTGGSGAVAGLASASGSTAIFTPLANLAHDVTYTATLTTGIRDTAGNALAGARTWTFTTAPVPDTTSPTVVSTDPVNGATNVAVASTINVTFSENLDLGSVTIATFTLDGGSGAVDGIAGATASNATFTPAAPLAYNTTYTATLTTEVRDIAGNPLAAQYSWTFTTELDPLDFGAVISNVSIASQGTTASVAPGAAFTLEFDFVLWNAESCPRCMGQIVIGIEGDAQDCVYDDIPEEFPGDGGHASLNLTAPLAPGAYAIRYQHDDQASCGDALTNYDNDPPTGNVIGTLTVTTLVSSDTALSSRSTRRASPSRANRNRDSRTD